MALPAQYVDIAISDTDWYTEEEYFALEDHSSERWEFLPEGPKNLRAPRFGRIRAMSGGTPNHSAIAMNLGASLTATLRGAGNQVCRVFGSDLKVHAADGRNTYPDVSVVCGPLSLYRIRRDVVTNPIFVAEVLSPSTAKDDRTEKWASYQTIPTLQHYLLIAADRTHIEAYTREESGWHFQVWESEDSQIPLPGLGVTLAMADIYVLVDFEID